MMLSISKLRQLTKTVLISLVRRLNLLKIQRLHCPVLLIGLVFILLWSFGFTGLVFFIYKDTTLYLVILVVATPCPLILAAPIAFISGMSVSARRGIIVKMVEF